MIAICEPTLLKSACWAQAGLDVANNRPDAVKLKNQDNLINQKGLGVEIVGYSNGDMKLASIGRVSIPNCKNNNPSPGCIAGSIESASCMDNVAGDINFPVFRAIP